MHGAISTSSSGARRVGSMGSGARRAEAKQCIVGAAAVQRDLVYGGCVGQARAGSSAQLNTAAHSSAHQLVLVPRLPHAHILVTLHGDIGECDGILWHSQALELQICV